MTNDASKGLGFDPTICDREPIHIPGAIQPHGVLLVLDPDDMTIVQAAGDTGALLGAPHAALLGQSLEARLGTVAATKLGRLVNEAVALPRSLLVFETSKTDSAVALDGVVHIGDGAIVIELEPQRPGSEPDPLALVQRMIANSAPAETIVDFADAVAREVAKASGFDRVLVYRFLNDGSGKVIAEARAEGVDSYLGLRFPASDIPRQARRLYLTNWLRLIPDAVYTPAPIEPAINPKTGKPLDLSYSVLRSVSPVHLQFLANMGVRASMSMSIVIDGKLWGLIACHHRTPHFLDTRRRAACEVFAQMVSLQFQSRLEAQAAKDRARAGEIQRQLVNALSRQGEFAKALVEGRPNLLDLIDAGGCAVFVNGKLASVGRVPSDDQTRSLVRWLDQQSAEGVFATNSLPSLFEPSEAYCDVASGLLALSVSRTPKDYVLWFRPELRQVVRWAGNPEKPVETASGGAALTPRASFEAWEQTVRFTSETWTGQEIETARSLRASILEVVLRALDLAMRERQAAQSHQDFLMAELDHRVKNTLAVIQSLVRFTARSATSLEEFNANLQNRLLTMARVQNLLTRSRWEGLSVRTIFEDELAPYRHQNESCCDISGDPVVLKPKAALAVSLAVHELATNAAKYGSLSAPEGRLRVDWRLTREDGEGEFVLTWTETGGPRVAPPTRAGFGRTLLERTVALDLRGKVELRFEPRGVECRLTMPASQIVVSEALRATQTPSADDADERPIAVAGLRVLLVEDSALVALGVREILEERRMEVVGPFASVRDALRAARELDFDIAVLDVDLDGEPVWPVADTLADEGSPFVFTTAFESHMVIPPRFSGHPVVAKPYPPDELIRALSRAAPTGDAA